MRDPARISRIMEKLQRAWLAHPDLRLGQLMDWIHGMEPCKRTASFHTEDDALETALDAFIANGCKT